MEEEIIRDKRTVIFYDLLENPPVQTTPASGYDLMESICALQYKMECYVHVPRIILFGLAFLFVFFYVLGFCFCLRSFLQLLVTYIHFHSFPRCRALKKYVCDKMEFFKGNPFLKVVLYYPLKFIGYANWGFALIVLQFFNIKSVDTTEEGEEPTDVENTVLPNNVPARTTITLKDRFCSSIEETPTRDSQSAVKYSVRADVHCVDETEQLHQSKNKRKRSILKSPRTLNSLPEEVESIDNNIVKIDTSIPQSPKVFFRKSVEVVDTNFAVTVDNIKQV